MTPGSALLCLALTVYFEARGEVDYGQQMVAQVVVNRSRINETSVCKQVFKEGQFSWTRKKWKIPKPGPDWDRCYQNASVVLRQQKTGTDYYFKSKKSTVHWDSRRFRKTKVIGNHIFYSSIPK